MENSVLQEKIIGNFSFLVNNFNFSITKNELHWLGGVIIEYEKNNLVISLLYDKRESWFYSKLFSNENLNKSPLLLHNELDKLCKLPNPIISFDDEEDVINYINSLSFCLQQKLTQILLNFEMGDYWKH